ncbi:hypothetical protein HMPREF3198_01837 [Winkia neuii]|nr:hypothetical protein HMPREF3198_01837 [Winkia neuii]
MRKIIFGRMSRFKADLNACAHKFFQAEAPQKAVDVEASIPDNR